MNDITVNNRKDWIARGVGGFIAGFIATIPMSIGLGLMYRYLLPYWQKSDLPPRIITRRISRKVKIGRKVNKEPDLTIATTLAHLGYGAMSGAAYAEVAGPIHAPTLLKGMAGGLILWAGSYMGWLPITGVMLPATKQPSQRTIMMIIAHLIWGSSVAWIYEVLKRNSSFQSASERIKARD